MLNLAQGSHYYYTVLVLTKYTEAVVCRFIGLIQLH